ncbi:MAG: M23 family metallopeptidase [bacterium]|nr:M23 family metallopeptidase [bacterium]
MRKLRGIFCFLITFLAIFLFSTTHVSADGEGNWYHLPYPKGLRIFNMQSPFSQSPESNHRYFAIDFKAEYPGYDQWEPAPVVAARSGWVVYKKDCDDGTKEEEANLLVLGHGPKDSYSQYQEYSWYLHLQKGSIPNYVVLGGYIRSGVIIGKEGHNGKSTGIHLHFAVTNWFNPSRLYTEGVPGDVAKAYLIRDQERIYLTVPFKFFEYQDVRGWMENNWVGSENVITEVTTDPREPQ